MSRIIDTNSKDSKLTKRIRQMAPQGVGHVTDSRSLAILKDREERRLAMQALKSGRSPFSKN